MPKLALNTNELVGTDVNFVSLVKRGANRIPFRIVKEDTEEMLDLNKIGRAFFQKADPTPGVLAALVRKEADVEAIKGQLTEAGLSVDNMEEKDGILIFKQDGQAEFDVGTLKINDDLGLVVSGIKKAFCSYDFESTSFGEVAKAGMFYPSMRTGAEMFTDTVYNIMQKADTPSQAAEMISSAADEFKQYMTALAGGLPTHAFKADVEVLKGDGKKKKPKGQSESMGEDDLKKTEPKDKSLETNTPHGNDTKTPAQTILNATEEQNIDGQPVHGNATPTGVTGGKQPNAAIEGEKDKDVEGDPANGAPKGGSVFKSEPGEGEGGEQPAQQPEMLAAISALLDQKLSSVTATFEGQVEALKSEVATIKVTADKAATAAQKADEALSGTVSAEPGEERNGTVQKMDRYRGAPPLLDTGYMDLAS